MIELIDSQRAFFVFLIAVIISSGCIETGSANLNSDFGLDYKDVNLDSSGLEVFEDSMSRVDQVSEYSSESDNSMVINLPGFSVSVNMTSNGVFDQNSSTVNTSGVMELDFVGNSNSTEFSTQVKSGENGTEVYREAMGKENHTEKQYSREELGVTLEALRSIGVENASVLGVSNISGEENILLDLDVNSSELLRNSEHIFEAHSIVMESTDSGEGLKSSDAFNQTEAYLWADRDDRTPSKFAYYGSVENGSVQVRSVTEYSKR
ncbi:hypothetical protein [Candidatus Nanohalobium constans]|uniref:Lipoprotein n=1 Tax=Candidatus Nanohalobium constans TaxID=2565781 RepID=A0A5Q0UGA5_9ARCH|nr:hypothetical protein [Candidatus Nanohalobium constans]QGA80604.1 hypothetical protein LC1Nh_0715 [Candidatus Nanohalobium constans]